MIKTITQHDVLQYVYGEQSLEEGSLIEQSIIEDDKTAETFHQLQNSKLILNQLRYEPSKETINNIYYRVIDGH